MARIEKTVFISYRRVDRWPALAVFKDLTQHGYDVFIDYDGIAAGDFERAIVDNIRARAHFLVVLTPDALERCDAPADWLRREIEVALDAKRNIVPLLLNGFTFEAPGIVTRLQGSLALLCRYQALNIPGDYFDAAMERLRNKYLAVSVEAVLHSASAHARQVAQEQLDAASKAADLSPAQEEAVVPSSVSAGRSPARAQHALVATGGPTDAAAQNLLGGDYRLGCNGREKNDAEAVKWYRKAAEQGHPRGQSNLGFMYEMGKGGLIKDEAEAVKWYRKAVEQGDEQGQLFLADMFKHGEGGLVKDLAQALMLYRQAAAQGNENAKFALKQLGEN